MSFILLRGLGDLDKQDKTLHVASYISGKQIADWIIWYIKELDNVENQKIISVAKMGVRDLLLDLKLK